MVKSCITHKQFNVAIYQMWNVLLFVFIFYLGQHLMRDLYNKKDLRKNAALIQSCFFTTKNYFKIFVLLYIGFIICFFFCEVINSFIFWYRIVRFLIVKQLHPSEISKVKSLPNRSYWSITGFCSPSPCGRGHGKKNHI